MYLQFFARLKRVISLKLENVKKNFQSPWSALFCSWLFCLLFWCWRRRRGVIAYSMESNGQSTCEIFLLVILVLFGKTDQAQLVVESWMNGDIIMKSTKSKFTRSVRTSSSAYFFSTFQFLFFFSPSCCCWPTCFFSWCARGGDSGRDSIFFYAISMSYLHAWMSMLLIYPLRPLCVTLLV